MSILALPLAAAEPDPRSGGADPSAARETAQVLALQGDLQRGSRLFAPCAACHGADGSGTPQGTVPAIAGQHAGVIARQLVAYRYSTRWDVNMEEVARSHALAEPQAIADLSAWVASLPRTTRVGQGNGANVETGRRLYARDCSNCHGAQGQGDAFRAIPRLAGQHYTYLLRQLHDVVEDRRLAIPPPHRALLADLDVEGLAGLADYVSRLPTAARANP